MNNCGTAKQKAVLPKEKKISEDHCDYLTSLVVDIVKKWADFPSTDYQTSIFGMENNRKSS